MLANGALLVGAGRPTRIMSQAIHCEPDSLTELLATFPLPVDFSGSMTLTGPWRLTAPQNGALFGVLSGCSCRLSIRGTEETVAIVSGDFIALGPACGGYLSSDAEGGTIAANEAGQHSRNVSRTPLTSAGDSTRTRFIGGTLSFTGREIHPLFMSLPPILHLPHSDIENLPALGSILSAIEEEVSATQPGSGAIVSHLAQALLIQAARLYLGETSDALHGLLHRELGPAIALIHNEPEAPWTVASLAERVNMSRSAFSASFTRILGVPPVQYLREQRMRTACRLLQDSTIGLKEVSSRVGYDSVSAFSTAFKRYSGTAPGDYRRRDQAASSG